MSNLEQISQAWHKLVEAALGKGYISDGDKSWLLSPDRIKITPIESGMLELSINFPSIDGVEEAKNIPLKIAAALSIEGVESDKIFNKVDVERDLGVNYSGEVKATLSNSEESLEILNGAKEKLEDVNLNLIEKAEEIKQTKNLEKISQAWHNLIEAAISRDYAAEEDRLWLLSPERVKVTPMEGGMVELSIDYPGRDGCQQASNVPLNIAGALAEKGFDRKRISVRASNDTDYGMTYYSGNIKVLVSSSEETIEKLSRAKESLGNVNMYLMKASEDIKGVVFRIHQIVQDAKLPHMVKPEDYQKWKDSIPEIVTLALKELEAKQGVSR